MIAVIGVGMVVKPAGFIVDNMRYNNAKHRKWEEHNLVFMPYLFRK